MSEHQKIELTSSEGQSEKPAGSQLVIRSEVPPQAKYGHYKRYLRRDFIYSCAYCTMTESEATARRFTIDHYEPVSASPELELEYTNLMYCCEDCNSYKGDRVPPPNARANGISFFRPDEHERNDHFSREITRLKHKSSIGNFTIEALDLNRASLQRLRDLRARIADCEEFISAGVLALQSFPIDQLPREIRSRANESIGHFGYADLRVGAVEPRMLHFHGNVGC